MTDNDRIELEALITEREGMIAENKHYEDLGKSVPWHGDYFRLVAEKMRALKEKA